MIYKIKEQEEFKHRYTYDIKFIQEVCKQNGYHCDLEDCANIWEEISDAYAASWLNVPDDFENVWLMINTLVERYSID